MRSVLDSFVFLRFGLVPVATHSQQYHVWGGVASGFSIDAGHFSSRIAALALTSWLGDSGAGESNRR